MGYVEVKCLWEIKADMSFRLSRDVFYNCELHLQFSL